MYTRLILPPAFFWDYVSCYITFSTHPLLLPLDGAPVCLVLLAAAAPLLPLLVPLAVAPLSQLLSLALPVSLRLWLYFHYT